jgi:oligosaccharide repeat unit polymerase
MTYFLILALLLIAHQRYVRRAQPGAPLLQADHLVDIFLLFFFGWGVVKSVYLLGEPEPTWPFTLGMALGAVALYTGMGKRDPSIPGHWVDSDEIPQNLREAPLKIAMYVHLLAAVAIMLTKSAGRGVSVWDYFTGSRIEEYLGGDILGGNLLYQLMTATLAAPLMLLWLRATRKEWLGALYVYALLVFSIAAVFVTRLTLVLLLLMPAFYFVLRAKRSGPRRTAVLAGAGLLFILLLAGLSYWRAYGLSGERGGDASFVAAAVLTGVENTTEGFDFLIRQEQSGTLRHEYGLNYWYSLVTFVPRSLWPAKPITAFEPRFTEYVTGQTVGEGAVIWTFTAWGEGLAQFGMFGIALNLFLFGKVLRWAESSLSKPVFLLVWAYYSILAVTYLRGGFQALWVLTVIYVLSAHLYLYWAVPKHVPEHSSLPAPEPPATPA